MKKNPKTLCEDYAQDPSQPQQTLDDHTILPKQVIQEENQTDTTNNNEIIPLSTTTKFKKHITCYNYPLI